MPDDRIRVEAVSIVIPARNEAARLRRLLPLLRERFGSVEIIVVDHGSKDETAAVSERLGARVVSCRGGAVGAARNAGARSAGGSVLAFLDADCEPSGNWLEDACRLLQEEQAVGAVGGGYCSPGETSFQRAWSRRKERARRTGYLPTSGLVVRRDAFEFCGGFAGNLASGEDVDFARRLRRAGWEERFDERLTVVHHGEPRTLRELFWQQLWHAQGSRWRYEGLGVSWVHATSVVWIPGFLALAGLSIWRRSVLLGALAAAWGGAPILALARSRAAGRELPIGERALLIAGAAVYLLARSLGRMISAAPWRTANPEVSSAEKA